MAIPKPNIYIYIYRIMRFGGCRPDFGEVVICR